MKASDRIAGASEESHYAVSEFARELIADVACDHFSPAAWQTLLSRSWQRSLEDIRECPARLRSFLLWAGGIAMLGATVMLLAAIFQTPDRAITALVFWLPWYAASVFFVITHLGMVDDSGGKPCNKLLLPNGLSFLRLALAPLVLWPCLQIPINPLAGSAFAFFLVVLSLSDLLDGWIARAQELTTRMGRMLDVLADLALLTFLSVGVYLAGGIPGSLLLLLLLRYPGSLIAILILYFARGPIPLRPTMIGRATTLVASIVLLAIAFKILLPISWPTPSSIEWSVRFLYFMIGVNILYLMGRSVAWASQNDSPGSGNQ